MACQLALLSVCLLAAFVNGKHVRHLPELPHKLAKLHPPLHQLQPSDDDVIDISQHLVYPELDLERHMGDLARHLVELEKGKGPTLRRQGAQDPDNNPGAISHWQDTFCVQAKLAVFGAGNIFDGAGKLAVRMKTGYLVLKAVAGLTLFVIGVACVPCAGGLLVAGIIFAGVTSAWEGYLAKHECQQGQAAGTVNEEVSCIGKGIGTFMFNGVKGGALLLSGAYLGDALGGTDAAGAMATEVNTFFGMLDYACTTSLDFAVEEDQSGVKKTQVDANLFKDTVREGDGIVYGKHFSFTDDNSGQMENSLTSQGFNIVVENFKTIGGETVKFAKCLGRTLSGAK